MDRVQVRHQELVARIVLEALFQRLQKPIYVSVGHRVDSEEEEVALDKDEAWTSLERDHQALKYLAKVSLNHLVFRTPNLEGKG